MGYTPKEEMVLSYLGHRVKMHTVKKVWLRSQHSSPDDYKADLVGWLGATVSGRDYLHVVFTDRLGREWANLPPWCSRESFEGYFGDSGLVTLNHSSNRSVIEIIPFGGQAATHQVAGICACLMIDVWNRGHNPECPEKATATWVPTY